MQILTNHHVSYIHLFTCVGTFLITCPWLLILQKKKQQQKGKGSFTAAFYMLNLDLFGCAIYLYV